MRVIHFYNFIINNLKCLLNNEKKLQTNKKKLKKLNIRFIDVHAEIFEKEKNSLILFPFELNGHYNKKGYNKIAELIYKSTSNSSF